MCTVVGNRRDGCRYDGELSVRGEGGEVLGGCGWRCWRNSRAESGDGRGRAVDVLDSDERGEGGMTASESDEPYID